MAFIALLQNWGVIRASGPDAQAFLHGQLTNDLLHLGADAAQWSAYCTAKGRMLAGFLVWRDGVDGFFLATDNALVPGLVKRLKMFVLRAKVVVEDASTNLTALGLHQANQMEAMRVRQEGIAWRIALTPVDGVARQLVWIPPADAAKYIASSGALQADASEWTRLMVRAGEAWITVPTQEQFVPQMVNFDALGGISFKKGCYPGQEIVARAHYRGAVKRRMYRATVGAAAHAADVLFTGGPNGQECGLVAVAAPDGGNGSELLAVLQIHSHDAGDVHLGAPDGPALQFAALPYVLADSA